MKSANENLKDKVSKATSKIKSPKLNKKSRSKAKIDFVDDNLQETSGGMGDGDRSLRPTGFDIIDKSLFRFATICLVTFLIYSGSIYYAGKLIGEKNLQLDKNILDSNEIIEKMEEDISYITLQKTRYDEKITKLNTILNKIETQTNRSFDVPNLLSKIMFIIPEDVRVTRIEIGADSRVTIDANSGQYAKLGYFVSRLKLENAMTKVVMEVLNMSSNIEIRVSGELP